MKETALITLGRLPVALDVARSLSLAGFRVLVADPSYLNLTRTSRSVNQYFKVTAPNTDKQAFLKEIANVVEKEQVTRIVPVSEETLYISELKASTSGPDVFCPNQTELIQLHDKLAFNKKASGLGLSVPISYSVEDPEQKQLTDTTGFVLKPRFSCSGRDIQYFDPGTPPVKRAGYMVQARIQGEHLSSFAIAQNGRVLINVVYSCVVLSGSVGVCFKRINHQRADHWVEHFVRETGHTGFIGFDFIESGDQELFAIECNPRATSGIHFLKPETLKSCLLNEELTGEPFRTASQLTESYSCFTTLLGSLFSSDFRPTLTALRQSTDITWSSRDPWPFLSMMGNTAPIIWRSIRSGKTFAEVAVTDVEWRDPSSHE